MKFLVLNVFDLHRYCSLEQLNQIDTILGAIKTGREQDSRSLDNRYLIVNTDEPYADQVQSLIEEHEGESVNFYGDAKKQNKK